MNASTPLPAALRARFAALTTLRDYIVGHPERLAAHVQRTAYHNAWFTPENQWRMLDAIAADYLAPEKLEAWIAAYDLSRPHTSPKTVGVVLAGNLPLVGFHDWLCVFVTGHRAQLKLSEKDPYLLPHLVQVLAEAHLEYADQSTFVERLKGFDAVIATGSDNTSRYFRQYFGKYPHIIRGNRTSVAILRGDETEEQLRGLADDVFAYFGLGCRSVGKVYVPEGYDFTPLLEVLHERKALANHTKWKNNYDYNYAMYSINREPFQMTGAILLREDDALHARLATLHYAYYDDLADVAIELHGVRDQLQAIVAAGEVPGVATVEPGRGQRPGLGEYADGVDVVEWLCRRAYSG